MINNYSIDELYIGMTETFEWTFSDNDLINFTEISGDLNPLHTNEKFAIQRGYKNKVLHGMLTSSLYSQLIGVFIPGENCLLREIKIQFHKPIYLNDNLKVVGEISYINQELQLLKINANISAQDADMLSKASIVVGMTK